MEVWKDIKGFEGLYQVSNLGRVKSLGRSYIRTGRWGPDIESIWTYSSKILKPVVAGGGHLCVHLVRLDKTRSSPQVSTLVAHAFIDPNARRVYHIDGDLTNNHVSNLSTVYVKKRDESL